MVSGQNQAQSGLVSGLFSSFLTQERALDRVEGVKYLKDLWEILTYHEQTS